MQKSFNYYYSSVISSLLLFMHVWIPLGCAKGNAPPIGNAASSATMYTETTDEALDESRGVDLDYDDLLEDDDSEYGDDTDDDESFDESIRIQRTDRSASHLRRSESYITSEELPYLDSTFLDAEDLELDQEPLPWAEMVADLETAQQTLQDVQGFIASTNTSRLRRITADSIACHEQMLEARRADLADLQRVIEALQRGGTVEVNSPTTNGASYLHLAIMLEDADMVQALLDAGATVDAPQAFNYTPLLALLGYNNSEEDRVAIAKEVKKGSKSFLVQEIRSDYTDMTALHWAIRTNNQDAVALLIEAGADPVAANGQGTTAYLAAMQGRGTQALTNLLRARRPSTIRGELNVAQDAYGNTLLYYAVLRDQVDQVRELLAAGADPNITNIEGIGPLHLAAHKRKYDIARELLGANANLDLKNNRGHSPRYLARRSRKMRKLFKQYTEERPSFLQRIGHAIRRHRVDSDTEDAA